MSDIFLSYAHEDRLKASALVSILAGRNWEVFWDHRILAGSVFDDVIESQLASVRCIVALWSASSIASQWVRAEAAEGADRNMLVSVLLEKVRIPIAFRRIQAANLVGWNGEADSEGVRSLIEAVSVLVPAPKPLSDSNASFPEPNRYDPRTLDRLETCLADFIGPIAGSLIRARNGKATSLMDLYEQLAREIHSEPERKQFLDRCRTELDLAFPGSGAIWSGDFLAQLVSDLSVYLGPVARIVVKRAASTATSTNQLHELVAREILPAADREAFLRSRRR